MITFDGIEIESRVGFTVHDPDGTSVLNIYVSANLPEPPNDGGREPLQERSA